MQRSSFPAAWRIVVVVVGLAVGSVGAFGGAAHVDGPAPRGRAAALAVSFDPFKVTLFARTAHCSVAAAAPPVRGNLVCG